MKILDLLFKKKDSKTPQQTDVSQKEVETSEKDSASEVVIYPKLIEQTDYSKKYEGSEAYFEYIDFRVSGYNHYQKEIRKAIKHEKDNDMFGDPYSGMTNREIMEDTFDEPIFQYEGEMFSKCSLEVENTNEHDSEAIIVYVNDLKVGYVPKRGFSKGKKYINKLIENNVTFDISASVGGGKYKVNRDDESLDQEETEYKVDCQITVKTMK